MCTLNKTINLVIYIMLQFIKAYTVHITFNEKEFTLFTESSAFSLISIKSNLYSGGLSICFFDSQFE